MKFENIQKKYEEVLKVKNQLESEIAEQTDQQKAAEAKAAEAATGGDLETYRKYKAEASALEESIFVKKAQLKKNGGKLKEEDVVKLWNKYASGYDKQIKSDIQEIEKAKQDLMAAMFKAAKTQNEALQIREKCGFFCGRDVSDSLKHDEILRTFHILTFINKDTVAHIVQYLTRSGLLHPVSNANELNMISSVVNMHAPYYN